MFYKTNTIVFLLALLLMPLAALAADSVSQQLQEAIYQEETAGDLEAAVEIYEKIIADDKARRFHVAQATYRLAMCYLKKGDEDLAARYFQELIEKYPEQKNKVKSARAELAKLRPVVSDMYDIEGSSLPPEVMMYIQIEYSKMWGKAVPKGLYANAHCYGVDYRFRLYKGGTGVYYNETDQAITSEIRLTGTSYPDQSLFDQTGKQMQVDIREEKGQSPRYGIYWTPDKPIGPGEYVGWGWKVNHTLPLPQLPGGSYQLKMNNHFGPPVLEAFFLVLPPGIEIVDSSEGFFNDERIGAFHVYCFQDEIPANTDHEVTVTLTKNANSISIKTVSPEELRQIVKSAVMTISTCAESDPHVQASMDSLSGLDTNLVLEETLKYLDDEKNTVRRAALYVLWKGTFENFTPAVPALNKLCTHEENYTRGMAALALGHTKEDASFRLLCEMTLHDKDPFPRRCAAYALGLMGRTDARDTLQKALGDPEFNVRNNAEAALTMIEQANKVADTSSKTPTDSDKQAAERLATQAWNLWREKNFAEAEKLFQQAVAQNPTNANAFNGLGWSQFNQGMTLNAKEAFEKCLALEPDHAAALNGLGWIAKNQGQTNEALNYWQKAVKTSPNATAALNGLTQTYMELKQYDEAVKYYQMWLKVEPTNQQAKDGLEKAHEAKANS